MCEEEYTTLVALYPYLGERAAVLRLPEVRYGQPVLIYSALPHPELVSRARRHT